MAPTLCTFAFLNGIAFAHNGPMPLHEVTSLRRRAQANAAAASYWPRRVLDDDGRRDWTKSSRRGHRGRSLLYPIVLLEFGRDSISAMYIWLHLGAFGASTLLDGRQEGHPARKKQCWDAGVVICLERGSDLHMVQLIPLPLTVSCFSKIQIGFTFLVKYTNIAVRSITCRTATGTHTPYRITQCYLPPDRSNILAFTPAEAGTRLSDPGGMQG